MTVRAPPSLNDLSFQRGNNIPFNHILFLGVFVLVHDCLFTIDRASHVRPDQHFRGTTVFPNQALTAVPSIAIWNKNKVAVVAAACLWGANAVFFIQGNFSPVLLAIGN